MRQHLADTIEQASREPVLIERRGKAAAVLVDPDEFQRMRRAVEELEDIAAFDAAMAEDGADLPWEQAKADLGWV
jgi:PHD/YefM family antitoxin component YafN of YafNO toxin-antitoxin module